MRDIPFPPRKKDSTPGVWQIGIFLRGPEGTILKYVVDKGTPEEAEALLALIRRDGKEK